jgi:hypothetical protein
MAQQAGAPQDGDTNIAPTYDAIFIPLFAGSLIFYCLRIWSHLRPVYKLSISDYVISLAVVMIS